MGRRTGPDQPHLSKKMLSWCSGRSWVRVPTTGRRSCLTWLQDFRASRLAVGPQRFGSVARVSVGSAKLRNSGMTTLRSNGIMQ